MKNILIVDDEVSIRELLTDQLSEKGYIVQSVENRDKALGLLAHGYKPDVILMDLMMPGMGLDEFVRRMRATTDKDIAIVLQTGALDGEDEADKHGLYYLPKMYSPENLFKTVALCCS